MIFAAIAFFVLKDNVAVVLLNGGTLSAAFFFFVVVEILGFTAVAATAKAIEHLELSLQWIRPRPSIGFARRFLFARRRRRISQDNLGVAVHAEVFGFDRRIGSFGLAKEGFQRRDFRR
jgi:hypothetical protein